MEDNYHIVMVFAVHQHESATGIHVLPPSWTLLPPASSPCPSGLSQSNDFGCPASFIELALVIYFTYGNAHVSVLFSQIIPPSPSPTESKSLFFTSISPWHPACRIISTILLNSIHMRSIQLLSHVWLLEIPWTAAHQTSLSIINSSHAPLLPLSPKVCSLCLCLLYCPARRIVGTIFWDSICMH